MLDRNPPKADALFVEDGELHKRIAPHLGDKSFRAALKAWSAEGFPPTISLMRGRFWPDVKAWLHTRYGRREYIGPAEVEDRPENFGGH